MAINFLSMPLRNFGDSIFMVFVRVEEKGRILPLDGASEEGRLYSYVQSATGASNGKAKKMMATAVPR